MASLSPEFSQRLKGLMQEASIKTQRALAQALEVSENAITNYVVKGRVPEWDVLVRMSKYFSVSVDWLLTGQDPASRPPPAFPGLTKGEREYLDKTLVVLRAKGPAKGYAKLLASQIDVSYQEVEALTKKSGPVRAKPKRKAS